MREHIETSDKATKRTHGSNLEPQNAVLLCTYYRAPQLFLKFSKNVIKIFINIVFDNNKIEKDSYSQLENINTVSFSLQTAKENQCNHFNSCRFGNRAPAEGGGCFTRLPSPVK